MSEFIIIVMAIITIIAIIMLARHSVLNDIEKEQRTLHVPSQSISDAFLQLQKLSFAAIDFETACGFDGTSACSLGVAIVEDGEVKETKHWYFKPPQYPNFDKKNIEINGITPEIVKDAPTFEDLWHEEIYPTIKDKLLVAHNAKFDIGVLNDLLSYYDGLDCYKYFNVYICTKELAQEFLDLENNRLDTVCEHLGIQLEHHKADSDANACAEIALNILPSQPFNQQSFVQSFINTKMHESMGLETTKSISPRITTKINRKAEEELHDKVVDLPELHDGSFWQGKHFVPTGDLSLYSRTEIIHLLSSKGAIARPSITSKTDIVVIGENPGWKKIEQITERLNSGQKIIIINDELINKIFNQNSKISLKH